MARRPEELSTEALAVALAVTEFMDEHGGGNLGTRTSVATEHRELQAEWDRRTCAALWAAS